MVTAPEKFQYRSDYGWMWRSRCSWLFICSNHPYDITLDPSVVDYVWAQPFSLSCVAFCTFCIHILELSWFNLFYEQFTLEICASRFIWPDPAAQRSACTIQSYSLLFPVWCLWEILFSFNDTKALWLLFIFLWQVCQLQVCMARLNANPAPRSLWVVCLPATVVSQDIFR